LQNALQHFADVSQVEKVMEFRWNWQQLLADSPEKVKSGCHNAVRNFLDSLTEIVSVKEAFQN
jgi:hypothetical protein